MVGTTCLKHITLIPKQNCIWRLFSVSIAWSSLVISSILTMCSTVTGNSFLVNSSNLRFPPDTKHLGKVSLSPQRRSFGSGCSWKEMSLGNSSNSAQTSSSSPANQSNFLSEERDELFFEMEGPTSPRSLPQTDTQCLRPPLKHSSLDRKVSKYLPNCMKSKTHQITWLTGLYSEMQVTQTRLLGEGGDASNTISELT